MIRDMRLVEETRNISDIGLTPVFGVQRDNKPTCMQKPESAYTICQAAMTIADVDYQTTSNSEAISVPAMYSRIGLVSD